MSTHLLIGFTAGIYLTHGSVPQTLLVLSGLSGFYEFMFSYPYYYLLMYITLGSMGSYHLLKTIDTTLKKKNDIGNEEEEDQQEEQEDQQEEEQEEEEQEEEEQEEEQEQEEEEQEEVQEEEQQEEQEEVQETDERTDTTAEVVAPVESVAYTELLTPPTEPLTPPTESEDMDLDTPPVRPPSPQEEQDTAIYTPLFQVINA